MARQLHLNPPQLSTSQTGLAAASLLLCVFALFMCASHSRKLRRWRGCYDFLKDDSPVIQHDNGPQIHATIATGFHEYQSRSTDSGMLSREQPLWRKNILMGGKCQLPDFSGVIIYDGEGNVVAPKKTPPLLTWK